MSRRRLALIFTLLLSCSTIIFAQSNNSGKTNYTFATSFSEDGKTVYISTVFCWVCSSNQPCNGVLYGSNSLTPCNFLQGWALSAFKKNQPGFNGTKTTVACLSESLTMYDFTNKDSIQSNRNNVINNYRNKLHEIVVIVTFPACKD